MSNARTIHPGGVDISQVFRELDNAYQNETLIAVVGTVTSIAATELGLVDSESEKLNGYRLSGKSISKFIEEFSVLNSGDIEKKYPPFLTGRGEVILAGILILDEFMKLTDRKELIISTGGIRHGILLA